MFEPPAPMRVVSMPSLGDTLFVVASGERLEPAAAPPPPEPISWTVIDPVLLIEWQAALDYAQADVREIRQENVAHRDGIADLTQQLFTTGLQLRTQQLVLTQFQRIVAAQQTTIDHLTQQVQVLSEQTWPRRWARVRARLAGWWQRLVRR